MHTLAKSVRMSDQATIGIRGVSHHGDPDSRRSKSDKRQTHAGFRGALINHADMRRSAVLNGTAFGTNGYLHFPRFTIKENVAF